MLSLCRIEAAFQHLHEYDPDLNISLLSIDDGAMAGSKREHFAVQARILRATLLARIADIVKQASTEPESLDTATAMVEVLIATYSGNGDRHGRGHKQAMQGIQLLASIYSRFDEAVDLFFDLVERFCAHGRSRGTIQANAAACADVVAMRMMQNYDQMLLKLISKHWNAVGPLGNWDIFRPLDRIKDLRDVYELRDGSKAFFSLLRRKDANSSLFYESRKMLQKLQKERVSQMVHAASDGLVWTPRLLSSRRSSPSLRPDGVNLPFRRSSPSLRTDSMSQERSSNESKSTCVTVKEVSGEGFDLLKKPDGHGRIAPTDAFINVESEVTWLYTIAENSESSEVVGIESIITSKSPCEADKARLNFHCSLKPIAPA